MLASSLVPKFKRLPIIFKGLPIIGILGLLIVSILIYRDSIFLEHGLPTFGDFDFPLPEIFLERNLYLWDESGMQFHGVWQLPRWLILSTMSSLLGEQLYIKIGLALAHFVPAIIGGFVVYHLLYQRDLLDNRTKKEAALFIGGLAYISAPIITNIGGISFFGLSLTSEVMIAFPLFVYAVLSTKRMLFRSLLVFACIIVAFGGSPREIIYYLFLVIPPIVVLSLVDRRKLVNSLVNVGKLLALVISISAFAWLPPILESGNIQPAYTTGESVLSYDYLELFSHNQELANSFRGLQKWWSIVDFSTENPILYNAWFISSWAIPIVAFSSLIIIRDAAMRKVVAVLGALSAIILFLVKGINPPFAGFYSWLVLEAPLPLGLNWMFREPTKFYNFFAFPIAFLLVIALLRIISSTNIKRQTVAVIALMICLTLYAWPLYTGNFKGAFHLSEHPEEYMAIRELLRNTEGNILWIPPHREGDFIWQKSALATDPITVMSPNPLFTMAHGQKELWDDIQTGLLQDQDSLLKYLERIGVRYIVLRNDMVFNNTITEETLRKFGSFVGHAGAKEIYTGKYLRAFQLPSNASYIYAYPQAVNNSVVTPIVFRDYNFESRSDYNLWANSTIKLENYSLTQSGNNLEVKLLESSPHWKTISSPVLEVNPDQFYFVESKIKARNIHEAHLKVVELNANMNIVSSQYLVGIGDGTFDWKSIREAFTPSNNLVRYIQFQIWHGDNSPRPLPNEISLEFFRYGIFEFNSDFYEQEALSYMKIDKTKYIVNIPQSLGSHVVVFPQFFNSLWVAKIDGKEYRPSSLYNSVNAFVVDKNGTMEIFYKPQQSFNSAVFISLASLGIAAGYSIYEWKAISIRKSIVRYIKHSIK
jgi:Alpha-(1->3)-arabinofuranosyltransferase